MRISLNNIFVQNIISSFGLSHVPLFRRTAFVMMPYGLFLISEFHRFPVFINHLAITKLTTDTQQPTNYRNTDKGGQRRWRYY